VMLRIVRVLYFVCLTVLTACVGYQVAVVTGLVHSSLLLAIDQNIVVWLTAALALTLALLIFSQVILRKRAERLPPPDDATFHA
jgi:hypothetical protein